jgi:hypothetical protein
MAAVGLQQRQHPGVVSAWLSGQRPGHLVGQMEVADAHRVSVAKGDPDDFGFRPRSDSRQGAEAATSLLDAEVDCLLEPMGISGTPTSEWTPVRAERAAP